MAIHTDNTNHPPKCTKNLIYGLASLYRKPTIAQRLKKKSSNVAQATSQPIDEDNNPTTPDGLTDAATVEISAPYHTVDITHQTTIKASSISLQATEMATTQGKVTATPQTDMPYGLCPYKDKELSERLLKLLKNKK